MGYFDDMGKRVLEYLFALNKLYIECHAYKMLWIRYALNASRTLIIIPLVGVMYSTKS